MQEIDDKIEELIAKSENDELMSAWLEFLEQKKANSERLASRLSQKDPVLIGALIGAFIGSVFGTK